MGRKDLSYLRKQFLKKIIWKIICKRQDARGLPEAVSAPPRWEEEVDRGISPLMAVYLHQVVMEGSLCAF